MMTTVALLSAAAIFKAEQHRITNFITVAPHTKRTPEDEWARLVLEQLGGAEATLEVFTRMER